MHDLDLKLLIEFCLVNMSKTDPIILISKLLIVLRCSPLLSSNLLSLFLLC